MIKEITKIDYNNNIDYSIIILVYIQSIYQYQYNYLYLIFLHSDISKLTESIIHLQQ
jgi:hypothetical protein